MPSAAVHLEEAAHLVDHVVEATRLVAARRLEGVAVHGVADPERPARRQRVTFSTSGGSASRTLPAPMRRDERQPARLRSGSSRSTSASASSGVVRRAELDADRVAHPATKSTCAPSSSRVRSPIHTKCADTSYGSPVRESMRVSGALVVEQQRLVAGVEVDRAQRVEVDAAGRHERMARSMSRGHPSYRAFAGVGDEAPVPRVHLAQVGEPALGERADEVQRRAAVW